MSQAVVAANLKRIRAAKGISQQKVAQNAGLSLSAYRKIETGDSEPRMQSLQCICASLTVPLAELLAPVVELQQVRFRSKKKLRTRSHIMARVSRWLTDYNELEAILNDRVAFSLAGLGAQLPAGPNRPVRVAQRVRKHLGLGPSEPIRDVCGLLEAAGVKVYPMHIASDAFLGMSVSPADNGPAVVVNTWERLTVERWIFSAAHELGHLILHLDDFNAEHTHENDVHEREADAFASEFLMPNHVFWREWRDTSGLGLVDRVLKVKRIFHVSYRTVLGRLAPHYDGWGTIWVRFQAEYQKLNGRYLTKSDEPTGVGGDAFGAGAPATLRSAEPASLSHADFSEDRLPRLVRQAVEIHAISLGRGAEILGISLAQMRDRAAAWTP